MRWLDSVQELPRLETREHRRRFLLNLIGFPEPMRVAVQGVILIAAAALSARRGRRL